MRTLVRATDILMPQASCQVLVAQICSAHCSAATMRLTRRLRPMPFEPVGRVWLETTRCLRNTRNKEGTAHVNAAREP